MKILVADDNEDARIIMETSLTAIGHEVVLAENGAVALQLARECAPDIVISDIMMPQMDGFQLCNALKDDNALKNIPFVLCTATFTEQQDMQLAHALGVSSFMVKPIDQLQLQKIIQEISQAGWIPQEVERLNDSDNTVAHLYERRLSDKLHKKISELSIERRQRELSEDHYQQLIENISDWVWQVDRHLNFTYVNPQVFDLLGFRPDELLHRNLLDLLPQDDHYHTRDTILEKASQQQAIKLHEHVKVCRDGRHIYLESHATPIINVDGEFDGYRGIDLDISERREIESARRQLQESQHQVKKLQTMCNLINAIAHDFNHNLMNIVSHTESSLRELPLGHPAQSALKTTLKEGYQAQRLVSQMLLFNEDHATDQQPMHLEEVIKSSLPELRASVPLDIDISEQIDSPLPMIHGDAAQIVQLISHIINNAVQAMSRGGRIDIELHSVVFTETSQTNTRSLPPGTYVELSISDTGRGIDSAQIPRIFDPFFSLQPTGAAGLGLAMVRTIADAQHAGINVSSEPGAGTQFSIYFPVSTEASGRATTPPEPLPSGRKETILFVDDEKALAVLGQELLETIGYEPVVFEDSRAALEAFRQDPQRFDLVVTDLTMPGLDGFELADELVAIRADIPIILLTGYLDKVTHHNVLQGPIREVIRKPMTPRGFAEAVSRVLNDR